MAHGQSYDWKRFWCPTDGSINFAYGGYLADPDQPYGRRLNPALRPFGEISDIPYLALLGEPGIGKTETVRAERSAIDAAVAAEGGGGRQDALAGPALLRQRAANRRQALREPRVCLVG